MEHFKPIVELMKVCIEKHGLWQTIIAFRACKLFCVSSIFYK